MVVDVNAADSLSATKYRRGINTYVDSPSSFLGFGSGFGNILVRSP
jgi:hypothetical protein